MARTNILTSLQESDILNGRQEKTLYERFYSEKLTEENPFDEDPLAGNVMLQNQRMNEFYQKNNISVIYGDIVNERPQSFKDAIKNFVDITSRFSERLQYNVKVFNHNDQRLNLP